MHERTMACVADPARPIGPVALLDGLVAQDFCRLRGALAPDAHLRALLPDGVREWSGAEEIARRFARWFGATERFDALQTAIGELGGRVSLRWRLRVEAERLGPGGHVVEQVGYADTDEHDRITRLDLVCTGFLPERPDARTEDVGLLGPDRRPAMNPSEAPSPTKQGDTR